MNTLHTWNMDKLNLSADELSSKYFWDLETTKHTLSFIDVQDRSYAVSAANRVVVPPAVRNAVNLHFKHENLIQELPISPVTVIEKIEPKDEVNPILFNLNLNQVTDLIQNQPGKWFHFDSYHHRVKPSEFTFVKIVNSYPYSEVVFKEKNRSKLIYTNFDLSTWGSQSWSYPCFLYKVIKPHITCNRGLFPQSI